MRLPKALNWPVLAATPWRWQKGPELAYPNSTAIFGGRQPQPALLVSPHSSSSAAFEDGGLMAIDFVSRARSFSSHFTASVSLGSVAIEACQE